MKLSYLFSIFRVMIPLFAFLVIAAAFVFLLKTYFSVKVAEVDKLERATSSTIMPHSIFEEYRQIWLSWGDSHCEDLSTGDHCWVNLSVEYDFERKTLKHFRELRAEGALVTVGELSEFDTATLLRRMYYHSAAVLVCESHLGKYDLRVEEHLTYKREVLSWDYHTSECGEVAEQRDKHIIETARRIGQVEFMRWLNSIH